MLYLDFEKTYGNQLTLSIIYNTVHSLHAFTYVAKREILAGRVIKCKHNLRVIFSNSLISCIEHLFFSLNLNLGARKRAGVQTRKRAHFIIQNILVFTCIFIPSYNLEKRKLVLRYSWKKQQHAHHRTPNSKQAWDWSFACQLLHDRLVW